MLTFLAEYGFFLAKIITIVVAILVVVTCIASMAGKDKAKEKLKVKKLNDKYKDMKDLLNKEILSKKACKKLLKEKKKQKDTSSAKKKRIFVIDFKGDIKASDVKSLRQTVTAILQVATPKDEVVVKITSQGGVIHGYGLAASQLRRIRERDIPLTTIVDKVAASGGYLMACIGNNVCAAPFAIIGSIGVIAQLPNFNKLLKKHNVDYEQIMAGTYKRTLSLFGENTPKGREKMQQEVEEAHKLFKNFIIENRPTLDIEKLATGEHWYGKQALDLGLVDKITTSDDYLLESSSKADIYTVSYVSKKKFSDKFSHSLKAIINNVWPFASSADTF